MCIRDSGVQAAVRNAWRAGDEVAQVTPTIVEEVAKFLRSSESVRQRFGKQAQEEALAAVSNFSFAPQRWTSKERSFSAFVLFGSAVM
eukprot:4232796-Alexandrium_andersonii.AAC.1